MSLLASFGIGIFDRQHFVVAQANSTTRLQTRQGTHVMAWLALEEWAKLTTSGDAFAQLVRPEGHSLEQWFHVQGGGRVLAPQARDWFMQWGMDLRLATKDRDARNQSSYRPDGVPITWEADPAICLEFVRDMWRLLEPSQGSAFEQMDRYILRLSVESFYRGSSGRSITASDPQFEVLVKRMLSGMNLTVAGEQRIRNFLCRESAPTDPSLFYYSTIQPGNPDSDAFAVVSRAVLLLRLATGSAHGVLESIGIDSEDLAFWWKKIGESRGLWSPETPPSELHDLWADVEDSLSMISEVEEENEEFLESFNSIATSLAPQLSILSSHERVGIWGLCPQ